ncbi:hypothetical protein PIB30_085609 [Stylosanthes scabra]|uniref:Uncharacterized protein n=1 Tax=Stylosanthes scabra TaxID=79078 RepID=A0ABU6VSK5_9FABA|nr:hypothetical protein [Stylosanthes scabra]
MSEDVGNMKDSWFFEKNFNGLSDEAFDDVFKFLDFPLEDVEPNVVEEDWDAQFKRIDPCFDVFSLSSTVLCSDKTQNEKSPLGGSFSGSGCILSWEGERKGESWRLNSFVFYSGCPKSPLGIHKAGS